MEKGRDRMNRKQIYTPGTHEGLLILLILSGCVALFLLTSPGGLFAQETGDSPFKETSKKTTVLFDAMPIYQPETHVSGGGSFAVARYFISANAANKVNDKITLGLGLTYEFEDYNFTRLAGFAVPDPWHKIHRVSMAGRLTYKVNRNWGIFFSPTVQYSGEEGADFGKSLLYGGTIGASYAASPDFIVGIGAGVFYRLEETSLFPTLIISWKITDKLRLGNSFRTGPAGPAGLELGYTLDSDWRVAFGGGYRSYRARLDSNGPVPNGIGQTRAVPIYLNLTRKLGKGFRMDLYGGAVFGGNLRLEDRNGNRIDSASHNTAPLLGMSLSTAF
ncbi:MAG: hypothetical protein C0392_14245 [Syntrophus sp. (in: bacteria)]|nr:hypothetical protein [Syntrophus sp. (in: bacteria)]